MKTGFMKKVSIQGKHPCQWSTINTLLADQRRLPIIGEFIPVPKDFFTKKLLGNAKGEAWAKRKEESQQSN